MRDDALSVIVCGSSATVGLPAYLMHLGNEIDLGVRVLLTRSAERFISPQVLTWYTDEVFTSDDPALNPTEFARRSIAIVVLPATANMLAAAALGLAGTPGQTALLAADGPVLFLPNMNATMWAKNSTQRHIATLRDDGHTVIDPPEQQIYELWRHEFTVGPAMPAPHQATQLVVDWLEKKLA